MAEIGIAVFLGAWLSVSAWVSYRHIKKELQTEDEGRRR